MYIVIAVISMLFFYVMEDKSLNIAATLGGIFIRRINSKELISQMYIK